VSAVVLISRAQNDITVSLSFSAVIKLSDLFLMPRPSIIPGRQVSLKPLNAREVGVGYAANRRPQLTVDPCGPLIGSIVANDGTSKQRTNRKNYFECYGCRLNQVHRMRA